MCSLRRLDSVERAGSRLSQHHRGGERVGDRKLRRERGRGFAVAQERGRTVRRDHDAAHAIGSKRHAPPEIQQRVERAVDSETARVVLEVELTRDRPLIAQPCGQRRGLQTRPEDLTEHCIEGRRVMRQAAPDAFGRDERVLSRDAGKEVPHRAAKPRGVPVRRRRGGPRPAAPPPRTVPARTSRVSPGPPRPRPRRPCRAGEPTATAATRGRHGRPFRSRRRTRSGDRRLSVPRPRRRRGPRARHARRDDLSRTGSSRRARARRSPRR